PGRATDTVLPELIHAALAVLSWPKSMRYPASNLRWVRPINSVICLFDGKVLNLPLGDVPVGRVTRGHRFLSPDPIEVANAADYRKKLAAAHVVLDWHERRRLIEVQLKEKVESGRLQLKDDQDLLDEVTGLVECPVVLVGSIDADFVRPLPDGLPPEVLATAMRTHQKYFTCLQPDGTPAPRFLFVANNLTPNNGKTIAAGNERVLRARLSDARFFWDQDRKIRLEDRVDALKQRVYHEKLGSVYDKVERMEKLAAYLAEQLAPQFVTPAQAEVQRSADHSAESFRDRCIRAARLAKADLSTGMVGEFPELQGITGRYYALNDGEDPRVADAIADHYKPLGPNDTCPTAPESVVAALADKIDALVAFFAVDEKPTGSGDPFALRRAAQGVIRIVLENNLRLRLWSVFDRARRLLSVAEVDDVKIAAETHNLLEFIADRLKVHLRGRGTRHDLITAVFESLGALATTQRIEDDLVRLIARVNALNDFLATDDGGNLLVAYRRASNIVRIEQARDEQNYDEPVETDSLVETAEQRLFGSLSGMNGNIASLLDEEDFESVMRQLAKLREPVDEFFEHVTVNVDDPKLRENRLRLLARIRATMNQVADFSQIEG
ncbi:MAG TPA: glycine--tRNA ligase subunit beta, partial [Stellaceae bacterium]|nr:glycine--tRNA ligase subunit beta [Stellaceae bacterium]